MPLGQMNAPTTFQRVSYIIVSCLKGQMCPVYSEDVIVHSKTAEEHVLHLDVTLTRLRIVGVTRNLKKCALFNREVEHLGHLVFPGQHKILDKTAPTP